MLGITGVFILSLGLYPFVGQAYFPRTDPGQFVINLKAPTGTRLELTDKLVEQVEQIVREVVPAKELKIIVSNIGVTPGFSSIYTPNSGPHTAFVQVGLEDGHKVSSFEYMNLVRARLQKELAAGGRLFPDRRPGGCRAEPRHARAAGHSGERQRTWKSARTGRRRSRQVRALPGVSDVLVPQDVDYPALKLDIDRVRASELGLNEKEVVGNVITALTSGPDDRAELLGGSQERQRLHADGSISGELHQKPRRPRGCSTARPTIRARRGWIR